MPMAKAEHGKLGCDHRLPQCTFSDRLESDLQVSWRVSLVRPCYIFLAQPRQSMKVWSDYSGQDRVSSGAGTLDMGECQRLCDSCSSLHSSKSSVSRAASRKPKCTSKARAHFNHRLLVFFLLAAQPFPGTFTGTLVQSRLNP